MFLPDLEPGGGGGYSLIIAIRVCAAQRSRILGLRSKTGYNIQAVLVERGIIFQMHESLKILSAILIVERGIENLPIFRTGCHFGCKSLLKRGLHLEAWAAHTHPKPTRVPPRDLE